MRFSACMFLRLTRLPLVEHIFYDQTYKNRSPSQSYIRDLDQLIELGKTISDEALAEAKSLVQPDHPLCHTFSSVRGISQYRFTT